MNDFHYRIPRSDKSFLHVFVKYPHTFEKKTKSIIFVHGFLGDGCENHRMFIRIADALNHSGFTCILYDQKGCGYSDGDYKDVRLIDIQEDLYIITTWAKRTLGDEVGFLGQSVGSALILSMQELLKPAFVVAINPAAEFKNWLILRYNWDLSNDESYYCALPKGIIVSRDFIIDLIGWDWIKQLKASSIPTMIIAATEDDVGSVSTAYAVKKALGGCTQLLLIEGANHSFTGQRELEKGAIRGIVHWLNIICTK